jgi:hypothetical protein
MVAKGTWLLVLSVLEEKANAERGEFRALEKNGAYRTWYSFLMGDHQKKTVNNTWEKSYWY